MKKKKLTLTELSVESFLTSSMTEPNNTPQIKGGISQILISTALFGSVNPIPYTDRPNQGEPNIDQKNIMFQIRDSFLKWNGINLCSMPDIPDQKNGSWLPFWSMPWPDTKDYPENKPFPRPEYNHF